LLEPQIELKHYAQELIIKNNVKWCTAGAGCKDELLSFTYVERPDSRSFIYSEKEANERGLKQEQIQVNRLDTIIDSSDFGVPEIVKIDAEGLDIDVLKGLGKYLGKVEVIFVEVALSNKVYNNTIEDVVSIMHQHGYRVFDVTDINRPFKNPVLWLMELAFIKKNSKIDNFNW
jgi:FkbM family methyltransferase